MLSLFVSLILTLCTSFGLLLRYAPFSSLVTAKQKKLLVTFYGVLSAANVTVWAFILHIQGLAAAFTYLRYGGIVYAVALTLVNILVIRGKTREHLFVFGVVLTCNYLLLSVPNLIITFIPQHGITASLFVVLGIYFAVLLLTYGPLHMLLCYTVTPFLKMDSGDYWNTVWFIPIAFFGTKFLSLGGEHNTGSIMQLVGSMLYVCVIVLMCLSIAASQKRLRERQILERQLAGQKVHYAELKVRVEDARKTKHDFKHHITAIQHYIDIDDLEGLHSYCDELMERIGGQGGIPYTGNAAADGILYHYMQRAQQEHIYFRYSGTIHSQGIADVDLCALLGNALDNAVAGSLTVSDGRCIELISQSEKQLLSIVIRNRFDGNVKQSGETIMSRKQEDRQGVGLASMRSICQRYGGSLDIQWDDRSFTAVILLPLKDE